MNEWSEQTRIIQEAIFVYVTTMREFEADFSLSN